MTGMIVSEMQEIKYLPRFARMTSIFKRR